MANYNDNRNSDRSAHRETCCCCIPIRLGVVMLLSMYLVLYGFSLIMGVLKMTEWATVFPVHLAFNSIIIAGFFIALLGAIKQSSSLFIFAPITATCLIICNTIVIILISILFGYILTTPELLKELKSQNKEVTITKAIFIAVVAVYALVAVLTIYYDYVFFKMYKLLKRGKLSRLPSYDPRPEYP